jgi:hypothetical protein
MGNCQTKKCFLPVNDSDICALFDCKKQEIEYRIECELKIKIILLVREIDLLETYCDSIFLTAPDVWVLYQVVIAQKKVCLNSARQQLVETFNDGRVDG